MTDLQIWVCVENNVVMMAASTPALKPLLGRKSGSQPTPYYNNSYEMNNSHPWSRSRGEKNSVTTGTFGDTYSEEHILPGELDPPEITKTVDVSVQYDNRSQYGQSYHGEHGRFPRLPQGRMLQ